MAFLRCKRDPCGVICLILTYFSVFYADYVVIQYVLIPTYSDRSVCVSVWRRACLPRAPKRRRVVGSRQGFIHSTASASLPSSEKPSCLFVEFGLRCPCACALFTRGSRCKQSLGGLFRPTNGRFFYNGYCQVMKYRIVSHQSNLWGFVMSETQDGHIIDELICLKSVFVPSGFFCAVFMWQHLTTPRST